MHQVRKERAAQLNKDKGEPWLMDVLMGERLHSGGTILPIDLNMAQV